MTPGSIKPITGARALGICGDSGTPAHISPAGSFKKTTPAGKYLIENGVAVEGFNSYGSRRGKDRVKTPGTFSNVPLKNPIVPGRGGGLAPIPPDRENRYIFDSPPKNQ